MEIEGWYNYKEKPSSNSHWLIFISIDYASGISNVLGPEILLLKPCIIAKLNSFSPNFFEKPNVKCCSITPGAKILNRSSLSGMGCYVNIICPPAEIS